MKETKASLSYHSVLYLFYLFPFSLALSELSNNLSNAPLPLVSRQLEVII